MARQTLFTARATSDEAAALEDASGAGAFILSADARRVAYRLTWDRLRSEKFLDLMWLDAV